MSAEILTSMFSELVTVVRSSGRGFATYLADVLKRCKVSQLCHTSHTHSVTHLTHTLSHSARHIPPHRGAIGLRIGIVAQGH